jgi:hypothetical protein
VDLTGDGRQSILTARAKLRKVRGSKTSNSNNNNKSEEMEASRPKNGQLVWLEMPKPHHIDEATGTPLEEDGTTFDPFSARHLPWKERYVTLRYVTYDCTSLLAYITYRHGLVHESKTEMDRLVSFLQNALFINANACFLLITIPID